MDAIAWETAACPLCGTAGDRDFFRAPGDDGLEYRLGQCPSCSMVYTNPRPDAASIARFYPDDYSPYQAPRRMRAGLLRSLRNRLGMRSEKSLFDRVPVRPGEPLLDLGCGSGWFAARMRDRGWNALGMDFSPHAVAAARKNFGLRVLHGTLPHPEVPRESLEAITLRAVLEHLHDPRVVLQSAYDALRPGGWLYASVPNLGSWGFRKFGASWFPLDPPRHLLHFTAKTLRQAVESCGFEVGSVATRGHARWMKYSVDRALRRSRPWWSLAAKSRGLRSLVARWTQWTNQADDLAILAHKPMFEAPAARQAA